MQENQQFTTMDSAAVYGSILLVMVLILAIFLKSRTSYAVEYADHESVKLADSLLKQKVRFVGEISNNTGGRRIASELNSADLKLSANGRIGLDPWGKAYHYKVFKNEKGRRVAVVLSPGPNMVLETNDEHFVLSKDGTLVEVIPQSDDIVTKRAL